MCPDMVSSVRRAQRLKGEKKKEERRKKEESLVKYKSTDNSVGRPNDAES